jgi:hypothetical protein
MHELSKGMSAKRMTDVRAMLRHDLHDGRNGRHLGSTLHAGSLQSLCRLFSV